MKIFFDLDGTLTDISTRHHRVYREVITELNGQPLERVEYWQLKRAKTDWPDLLKRSGLTPAAQENFLRRFIAKIEQPDYLAIDQLLPEALSTLQGLAKQHQCYLVSLRRQPENLRHQIENLKIDTYFHKVLSGHSETDGSDRKTELIKPELISQEKALIVGDTEADIKAGQALEIITVAVTSGIRDEKFLKTLKQDYTLSSVSQLVDLFM